MQKTLRRPGAGLDAEIRRANTNLLLVNLPVFLGACLVVFSYGWDFFFGAGFKSSDIDWGGVFVLLAFFAVSSFNLYQLFSWRINPASQPERAEFEAAYAGRQGELDAELQGERTDFPKGCITRHWFLARGFFGFQVARLEDLQNFHKRITKEHLNGIRAGTKVEAVLSFKTLRRPVEIAMANEKVEELLALIDQASPADKR